MRNIFKVSFLALVAVTAVSSASFAQKAPAGHAGNGCFVNHDANQFMPAEQFFSMVNNESKSRGCAYGKLDYVPNSGRVYFAGRAVVKGASNSVARQAIAGRGCAEYTCYEFGPVGDNSQTRGGTPPPPQGGYN